MIKLPIYKSKAYRAESNLLVRGYTALDVIRFEERELGNVEDFKHLSKSMRKKLSKISSKEIVWVCKTKEEANDYGEAEQIDIGKNPKIIAEDNCGGYLVLKG
jgi:hypothetical protein